MIKIMRVIKLSPNDRDMLTRHRVDTYFREVLPNRSPKGQFLLTKSRIAPDGIQPNERIVFTYMGEIVYQARALTGRTKNLDKTESEQYPYYFCVNLDSIEQGCKSLSLLENELKKSNLISQGQNLVKTQAWPIVKESDDVMISEILNQFLK
jgi:hypothetical protein